MSRQARRPWRLTTLAAAIEAEDYHQTWVE